MIRQLLTRRRPRPAPPAPAAEPPGPHMYTPPPPPPPARPDLPTADTTPHGHYVPAHSATDHGAIHPHVPWYRQEAPILAALIDATDQTDPWTAATLVFGQETR